MPVGWCRRCCGSSARRWGIIAWILFDSGHRPAALWRNCLSSSSQAELGLQRPVEHGGECLARQISAVGPRPPLIKTQSHRRIASRRARSIAALMAPRHMGQRLATRAASWALSQAELLSIVWAQDELVANGKDDGRHEG